MNVVGVDSMLDDMIGEQSSGLLMSEIPLPTDSWKSTQFGRQTVISSTARQCTSKNLRFYLPHNDGGVNETISRYGDEFSRLMPCVPSQSPAIQVRPSSQTQTYFKQESQLTRSTVQQPRSTDRFEQQPAATSLHHLPPPLRVSTQTESHAGNGFDLNSGFKTMELVSPASAAKVANKKTMPRYSQQDSNSTAVSKPLFVVDENKNNFNCRYNDTVVGYDEDAVMTPQNSCSSDSESTEMIPPCCLSPTFMPPSFPMLSSLTADNFSSWQPGATTGASYNPHFSPVFPSPPPPPPPGMELQPRVPPLMQLSAQSRPPPPPQMAQQPSTNSWLHCHTPVMQQPSSSLLPPPPPPPPPPPQTTTSEIPSPMETSWQQSATPPPPFLSSTTSLKPTLQLPLPPRVATNLANRLPESSFGSAWGYQPGKRQSSERATQGIKKMPECGSGSNRNKAIEKPLFETAAASSNAAGMDAYEYDNDTVPASWEDIDDSEFPPLKAPASAAAAATDRECCNDVTPDDEWFNVKPGQLEASKWSLTFSKQVAATPPVRFSGLHARTAVAFSAPTASQFVNSEKKRKKDRQSLNLFRPGTSDEDAEPVLDWCDRFQARYAEVTVPYYDSHCHLDFLFKRSGFKGSFKKYRQNFAKTFPSNFLGCVAVFCSPSMWSLNEGKICLFFYQLYYVANLMNTVQFSNFLYLTDYMQQSQ